MITRNRHGQDGAQDPGCQLAQLLRTDILLHLPGQLEVLEDGSSMKQLISALPEDKCQFLVVIRHHLGLEDFFAQDHEAMDVLKKLTKKVNKQLKVIFTNKLKLPR